MIHPCVFLTQWRQQSRLPPLNCPSCRMSIIQTVPSLWFLLQGPSCRLPLHSVFPADCPCRLSLLYCPSCSAPADCLCRRSLLYCPSCSAPAHCPFCRLSHCLCRLSLLYCPSCSAPAHCPFCRLSLQTIPPLLSLLLCPCTLSLLQTVTLSLQTIPPLLSRSLMQLRWCNQRRGLRIIRLLPAERSWHWRPMLPAAVLSWGLGEVLATRRWKLRGLSLTSLGWKTNRRSGKKSFSTHWHTAVSVPVAMLTVLA